MIADGSVTREFGLIPYWAGKISNATNPFFLIFEINHRPQRSLTVSNC